MNVGFFILGMILLVGGIVLFGYTPESDEDIYFAPPSDVVARPYLILGAIIAVMGLVFMIMGAVTSATRGKVAVREDDV